MSDEKKVLVLDSEEQRIIIRSLNDLRTSQLQRDGPTDVVEDLMLKVIDAPSKRERRRASREAR